MVVRIASGLRSHVILECLKLRCRPAATNEIRNESPRSKSVIHVAADCPNCIRQLVQSDRYRRDAIRCECECKIPAPEERAEPWRSSVGITVRCRILKRPLAHALQVFGQRLVCMRVSAKRAQAADDILKWSLELETICGLEFVRSENGPQQRLDVPVSRSKDFCYTSHERS